MCPHRAHLRPEGLYVRQHPEGWALHCVGRQDAVVHVVPDATWPGMWRVRDADGRLSDMANLTWARDGAIAAAMRILDPRRLTEQRAPGAVQASFSKTALPDQPPAPSPAPATAEAEPGADR